MIKLIRKIRAEQPQTAIALLAAAVPELSKGRLKDAMNKGAVILHSKPERRLRRAQAMLKAGEQLTLHYDETLLQRQCDAAQLLADQRQYSIWFKPAGMLSQGNEWGDHLSLLRAAEVFFTPLRQVYLIHRLDREASGLVILAHTRQAAAAFSKLIAERKISKQYQIRVKGQLNESLLQQGVISAALDGKDSVTAFRLLRYDAATDCSWLEIDLITGRKHQIRRHFAGAGHPVMGDPAYGQGNKDNSGLALQAVQLRFDCPVLKKSVGYTLPAALQNIALSTDPSLVL
ncbi:RluA family pseudouridine synthase [Chromatiaceae bacterium AAb-1]|nr:RluA family pseudouridine synthase [Chromatiaceae bacterium AAb-1]